jgi:hypothetical protein
MEWRQGNRVKSPAIRYRMQAYEDVFGGHDDDRVDGGCAYMLLYCRTATASIQT